MLRADITDKYGDLSDYEPYETAVDMAIEALSVIGTEMSLSKWIPVSERLPKHDDWKIVTILDEHGDTPYRYTDFGWYLEEAKCWIVEAERRTDVIAWMPLPEPYKGEEDD